MTPATKIYFASDLHLGTPDYDTSLRRERLFVEWLEIAGRDAAEIYLVGDTFDFWHDYKTVVPKGYVRLLGKLAELSDRGVKLHIFTGNHDLWFDGYFEKELGARIYTAPTERQIDGKEFFIGHGDGLGPKDHGYKFIKRVFTNPVCQWLFRWIHPDLGIRLASYLSYRSRYSTGEKKLEQFLGEDREWLVMYCRRLLSRKHYDYFISGHRHLPLDINIDGSRYINLGDWLDYNSYAVWDGRDLRTGRFTSGAQTL
ncbi:MAG: UDP-2,3-diacylglucosamine diphosphatase [Bacteroidetes bacterium]|nr:UDP-2,3-diacylglucosamine diphosphatase [Bacteroidota bacterium]